MPLPRNRAHSLSVCWAGHPLYNMYFGNPAMRARHMPFVIDETARREWLACFDRVLEQAPQAIRLPGRAPARLPRVSRRLLGLDGEYRPVG